MTASAGPNGAAGPAEKRPAKPERGKQFWTVEHLTSAPVLLTVATVLLCLLGLVMVFSASSIELIEKGKPAWNELRSQAMYLVLSTAICVVLRKIGASVWVGRLYYAACAVIIVLLVLVLFIGTESHGAKRWLLFAGMSLQPSELAKITIIMGAAILFDKWGRGAYTAGKALALSLLYVVLPFVLILAQKDLGTLLIIGSSLVLMAVLAGVRIRYLVLAIVLCVVAALALILFESYRGDRFRTWLDPYADYYGDGWQPIHGTYAFASGGFLGLGLGNSRQKYSYLPEAQNDYVYAIIGEELGFVGAFGVILLFVLWGWSGLRIAYRARSYSRAWSYMAAGLTVLIEAQALLNIGGVLGVIPLSGRTLPFISSGGSSILSCLAIVGLLLGVACNCDEVDAGRRTRPTASPRAHLTVIDGGASAPRGSSATGRVAGRARTSESERTPRSERASKTEGMPGSDRASGRARTSGHEKAPGQTSAPRRERTSGRRAGEPGGAGTAEPTRTSNATETRPRSARPRPERHDEPERRRR